MGILESYPITREHCQLLRELCQDKQEELEARYASLTTEDLEGLDPEEVAPADVEAYYGKLEEAILALYELERKL